MKRIIAYNLFHKDLDKEVYKILPQMLVVEPRAEYYSVNGSDNCILYFPVYIDESEIEESYKYTYYKISGKLYDSAATNKIDYWLEKKAESVQMTLF